MDCADLEPIEEPLQKYWAGLAYKLARASEYLKFSAHLLYEHQARQYVVAIVINDMAS